MLRDIALRGEEWKRACRARWRACVAYAACVVGALPDAAGACQCLYLRTHETHALKEAVSTVTPASACSGVERSGSMHVGRVGAGAGSAEDAHWLKKKLGEEKIGPKMGGEIGLR